MVHSLLDLSKCDQQLCIVGDWSSVESFHPKKMQVFFFFIWSLIHRELNTNEKYQNRRPSIYFNRWIYGTFFLHNTCSFSKFIWLKFYSHIDATASSPISLESSLTKFLSINPNSHRNILLTNIFGASLWCISGWKETTKPFKVVASLNGSFGKHLQPCIPFFAQKQLFYFYHHFNLCTFLIDLLSS